MCYNIFLGKPVQTYGSYKQLTGSNKRYRDHDIKVTETIS